MCLTLRRTEQGKGDLVVEFFERDFQLHIEFERLRRLRAIDDVAHHAWTFVQFHHGDGVRRREARHRAVMDHVAVELCLAAGFEHADLARGAGRTERARREIDVGAGVAALQAQLACLRAIPEMLGFRRRFRSRARWLSHVCHFLPGGRAAWPVCCDLVATFDYLASTVQRSLRMPRIPADAQSLARSACMLSISRARVSVIARSASDEATSPNRFDAGREERVCERFE